MSVAPPAASRRLLHLRRITCEAFEREDGLLDIEALLIDTKPTAEPLVTGRVVEPGEAIHRMRVRLTVDRERRIVAAGAYSEERPYPECEGAEEGYRKLVGLRIEPGFTRQVKQLFRGEAGCTHISELIPPMATTLFQVLWADADFANSDPAASSPVGACHGLRRDGHVVRTYFPALGKESRS
ncbi:MAG: hypothetical protein A2710_23470 [Burkholderiales bacterium RIFCSPHIGHO2_01_FULL_64_960]|nr:MAG: hypothetical protein A2710_23470 [Burkholderiales bacterium RIFCSPHIGHO2_01_FULL_64_960]